MEQQPRHPLTDAEERVDVLIVGASTVGLALAALLGVAGVSAVAVERHPRTTQLPRAGHFHLRTAEILRVLGIEETARAAAELQYHQDGGVSAVTSLAGTQLERYITDLNDGVEGLSPSRRMFVTQDVLEPLLCARALEAGADLRYRTPLLDFTPTEDGIRARVSHERDGGERTIRARYLVGCDGAASGVRRRLGISTTGRGVFSHSVTIYFRADCRPYVGTRRDAVVYIVNDELRGYLRLNRRALGGRLVVNTVGDPARADASNVAPTITPALAVELIRAAVGEPDLAVEVSNIAPWRAAADVAGAFGKGRVLLAGDSAHVMPPNGGFGGNTGVQDAFNLAWKLAMVVHGQAGPGLLGTYDAERRPIARLTAEQAYARYVARIAPQRHEAGVAPILPEDTLEVGHCYRSSAVLSDDEPEAPWFVDPRQSRGRPGARAPHVWIDFRGARISTLDLFGHGFVLLVAPEGSGWAHAALEAGDSPAASPSVVRFSHDAVSAVDEPSLTEAFGLRATGAALVRPDGYVAWRAPSLTDDPARTLATVLDAVLDRRSDDRGEVPV